MRRFLLLLLIPLAGCNPKLEASIDSVTPTDKGYEIWVKSNRTGEVQPEGLKDVSRVNNGKAWVLLRFDDLATLPRPVKLIVTSGDQKKVLELSNAQVPGELAPIAGDYAAGIDVVGPKVSTAVSLSGSKALLEFKLEPGQQLVVGGEELEGSKLELPLFPLIQDAKKFGSEDETQKLGELEVKRTGPDVELSYVINARTDGLKALRETYVSEVLKGGVPGEKTSGTRITFSSYFDEKWGRGFISGPVETLPLASVANLVLRKHTFVDGPNCPNKYVNPETGEKIDVKRYHVDLSLEVFDTATGKSLGQHAFKSRISDCPETVLKRADMEASVGGYVDAKAIDAWLATVER